MSGWRPSLRLAWRDVLRSKGRSALVLVMIALPVLAVTTADIAFRTSEVTGVESLDRRIGAADALVEVDTWASRVFQQPDPQLGNGAEADKERPLPALDDLSAELGRPVRGITLRETEHRVETAHGVSRVEVTEADLADPLADGLWHIDEGRAPQTTREVAVNRDLTSRGPGLGDTLQVVDGPALTVVGIGESASFRGAPMMAVSPTALTGDPAADGRVAYLIDAGGPVTWNDVLALNRIGAVVTSRHVLEHPPAPSELPADAAMFDGGRDAATWTAIVLIVVMALMEVVLLAGPAFAVGARRQSRTLALMAATGGTPAQARRTVLAGGVVLGGVGAVAGVVLGLGAAWLVMPLLQRFSRSWFGPYDVAWGHLAAIAAFGLVSAVLAAVVPAWIASRQDVVAVLAGRRGDRRASLRSPVLGVLLLAVGIAGSAYGATHPDQGELVIAGSAVVSVLGMILLTPVVLVLLARLGRRLPLTLRFAVRDAARHRTRSVPAVAAVAATVAGVVALGVAVSSDDRQNEATYSPTLREGDGVVTAYGAAPATFDRIATVVRRGLPGAQVVEVQGVDEDGTGTGGSGEFTMLDFRAGNRRSLLSSYGSALGSSVLVADAMPSGLPGVPDSELAAADRVLGDGGAVVFTSSPVPQDTVTISGEVSPVDGDHSRRLRPRTAAARFIQVPDLSISVQAVLSPEVAAGLGVDVRPVGVAVTGREITASEERDVGEAVGALVPGAALYVERGYQPDDATRVALLILVGLGAVLMLGGTLTATFLALSDARPDLATLSAVGAAPRTRRGVAASSALVIALTGAVLGAVVGLIPGIAVSFPLTAERWATTDAEGNALASHYLAIPWPVMGALVLALPLVTAAAIALLARSRLPMVARLD